MDCLFCAIISGKIPCEKVFEDEHTLAFMDINPLSTGHVLVIPKTHATTLFDANPEHVAQAARTATRVAQALQKSLGIKALNLLQNNGAEANQSVGHVHFHLIPRQVGDGLGFTWLPKGLNREAILHAAAQLRNALK